MQEEYFIGPLFRIFFQSKVYNIFLNFEKCTLSSKDNAYGDIDAPAIEITSDNEYIYIWSDTTKL